MDVSSANEETPAPKSQGPADDKFDETIYTVVSTGKTSETNDTDDLFQTSFATLLDGSEFMSGIFEKNDNDKVEEYEDRRCNSYGHEDGPSLQLSFGRILQTFRCYGPKNLESEEKQIPSAPAE